MDAASGAVEVAAEGTASALKLRPLIGRADPVHKRWWRQLRHRIGGPLIVREVLIISSSCGFWIFSRRLRIRSFGAGIAPFLWKLQIFLRLLQGVGEMHFWQILK